MNVAVFWDVSPCGLAEINRRFGGAYCHQDPDNSSTTETTANFSKLHGATSQKTAIFIRYISVQPVPRAGFERGTFRTVYT
jgi:hypothetical protein